VVAHPHPQPAPRPADPLAALRCPLLPSGFHGVYAKRKGGRVRWQAKPFRRLCYGHYPTPKTAAEAVAKWWADRYGPDWPKWFAKRKDQAWRVVRADPPPGAARPKLAARRLPDGRWEAWPVRPHDRVYRAVCWVDGVYTVCFPPVRGAAVYADRASAAAGFRHWSRANLGLFAPAVLRRCG
jgi:hypothetical protein